MVIDVGYKNFVLAHQILAVVNASSNAMIRTRQSVEDNGQFINCSKGHKIKTLLIMGSGHIVGSALETDKIKQRLSEVSSDA